MNAPHPLRILVADDDGLQRQVIRMALQRLGHSGVAVADGQQALRALQQHRFDALLLDASMPVLGGLATLAALRAAEAAGQPRTPVIMLSGYDTPEDRARFLAAGADSCLSKPLDTGHLARELARVAAARG
jgi:CheY-like chemotaxis protein